MHTSTSIVATAGAATHRHQPPWRMHGDSENATTNRGSSLRSILACYRYYDSIRSLDCSLAWFTSAHTLD